MPQPPNEAITEFEKILGLGATFVARILGIAYPTYAAYRAGSRYLPQYHLNQMTLIVLLSEQARAKYLKERLDATRHCR